MSKIVVGMSGGVDSAVAAYLLKEAGHEVIGVMLRTWSSTTEYEGEILDEPDEDTYVEQNKCCEIDDARAVCFKLGIPFYPFNCVKEFSDRVISPFVEAYISGKTPNPCIECNRYVKFEKLIHVADILKADFVATGHYAKKVELPNGRLSVKRSDALKKDQTYMLYKLSQDQLKKVIFPLGEFDKKKVREIAQKALLPVADKKDSQEICFVPDDDYAGFINRYCLNNKKHLYTDKDAAENSSYTIEKEGDFIDKAGNVLGRHKGIIHYTIGQRKGLGLSMGHPVYVCKLLSNENKVVIGEEEDLFSSSILIRDYNLMSIEDIGKGERIRGIVKIRYHHAGEWAYIEKYDEECLKLTFDKPVKSPTPGQSAVFYDEDGCVLGGGIISYR